jgi:hypothetical protein
MFALIFRPSSCTLASTAQAIRLVRNHRRHLPRPPVYPPHPRYLQDPHPQVLRCRCPCVRRHPGLPPRCRISAVDRRGSTLGQESKLSEGRRQAREVPRPGPREQLVVARHSFSLLLIRHERELTLCSLEAREEGACFSSRPRALRYGVSGELSR